MDTAEYSSCKGETWLAMDKANIKFVSSYGPFFYVMSTSFFELLSHPQNCPSLDKYSAEDNAYMMTYCH